jgi:hypothetical protein
MLHGQSVTPKQNILNLNLISVMNAKENNLDFTVTSTPQIDPASIFLQKVISAFYCISQRF